MARPRHDLALLAIVAVFSLLPLAYSATYNVQLGFEDFPTGAARYDIAPCSLTVAFNDTVVWSNTGFDRHTLWFPAQADETPPSIFEPCPPPINETYPVCQHPYASFRVGPPSGIHVPNVTLSSGTVTILPIPGAAPTYSLTFLTPGTWTYANLYYVEQRCTVTVLPPGSPAPKTPAEVTAEADAYYAPLKALIPAQAALGGLDVPPPYANNAGTYTYNIKCGHVVNGTFFHRFYPSDLPVYQGDVVRFYLPPGMKAPHQGSFYNGGQVPQPALPIPNPGVMSAPWNLVPPFLPIIANNPDSFFPLNPVGLPLAFAPIGLRDPLTDVGAFTTGFLTLPELTGENARPEYEIQTAFNLTGNLSFICDIHVPQGMVGNLEVRPRPVSPDAPVVYHLTQYTNLRDGPGVCSEYQFADTYSVPASECTRVLQVYPFQSFMRLMPSVGPTYGPDAGQCTSTTCVHVLRWDLFNTLAPCFAPVPPSVAAVIRLDQCMIGDPFVNYFITAAAGLVPSWGVVLVAICLAWWTGM